MTRLIEDIIVTDKQKQDKPSHVRELITKLRQDLAHKKPLSKKTSKRDAELADIMARFRNRY